MFSISQVIDSSLVQGSDIQFNNNGDIAVVSGTDLTNQRILRRLMTIQGSYLQHPTYGGNLPLYIGKPLSDQLQQTIIANITGQVLMEDRVAKFPVPVVTFLFNTYSVFGQIVYYPINQNVPVILEYQAEK